MIFNKRIKKIGLIVCFIYFINILSYSQCSGISADAGPDLYACDLTQLLQLQGNVQGNYTKFYWTPVAGLSNPNVLDPTVTIKQPGRYTFTLTAEGISNVNLITNGDFESGNTGFTTGYTYTFVNTTEGEYFIASNPATWNGGFSPCPDHTTGSGNMMLLNGHPIAGTNCWCQTVATVVGRSYQFEFWSQSLYPVNIAQLNVKVNGTSVGSTQAGGLCDWQRFMVMFTATTSSTTLCISETTGIRGGNDFAIDDIAMYEKCKVTDDVIVELVNLIAKIDIPFKPKCSSDAFDLTAVGSSAGANITYEWSTDFGDIISQNGLTAKGKGSGTYTIKVSYTNGNVHCETTASIEYIAPDVLAGNIITNKKITCSPDSVIIKTNMTSGSGLYTYKWSPDSSILKGQNMDSVFVRKAKKYSVTVTDQSSGCTLVMATDVTADTIKPLAEIKGDSLLNCIQQNAVLNSTQKDTAKYKIQWIVPDLSVTNNRSSISSTMNGNYKLIIEDKTNFCKDSTIWAVHTDTIHPLVDLGPDLNINCNNDSVSVINLLQNTSGNLSYYWTLNHISLLKEDSFQNKIIKKSEPVQLRIRNESNGCETTDSLFVTDSRSIPQLDAGNNAILNCKIKSIQLNAITNPADSLDIFWTSNSGNIVSGKNTTQAVIDKKGWYYIQIKNRNNGCQNNDSLFVDENFTKPDANAGSDLTFSCIDTVKTIDGSASSSGNNIIYQWSGFPGVIKSGNGTNTIIVSSPGAYQLIVQDTINGCSDTASIKINPDVNKPIVSVSTPDTLSCKKISVILKATATAPTGDPLSITWSDILGKPIGMMDSLQTTVAIPGVYQFTATDKLNGCSSVAQTTVLIDTIKPTANAGVDQVWNCKTQSLNLDGSNSFANHSIQFDWTTQNGIIQGNNQSDKINIRSPGTYQLKIIDLVNGCESFDDVLVIKDQNFPIAEIQIPDFLNCIHPVITIYGNGSSSGNNILYHWSTANGNILSGINQIAIDVNTPGQYTMVVTDTANGCSAQLSILVFENKQIPFVDAGNDAELDCSKTDLVLTGNIGNNTDHIIQWKTNQGNILSRNDSIAIKINKTGTYILEVIDSGNGCSNADSVVVSKINNLLVDAGTGIELTCKMKNAVLNGSIQNNAGNELTTWTTTQGHFTGNANGLQVNVDKPGWYYFLVSNVLTGCNGIDSVLITENTNIPTAIQLDVEQPKCPGDSWYTDITNIKGGEQPIQIYLNNQLINGLSMSGSVAGNYKIQLIDKNGCDLTTSFNIINPTGVSVQLVPLVQLSEGQDYNLTPMYSIPDDSIATVLWTPSDFLNCMNCPYPLIKGIDNDIEYTVSFTNHNGCTASAEIKIEIIRRNIWVPNVFSPNGDNINDWFYPIVTEYSFNSIRLMSIYDRWGNQVFNKENFQPNIPTEGWNGEFQHEKMNPGVYVYIVEVEWKNGERQLLKGDLTLMR